VLQARVLDLLTGSDETPAACTPVEVVALTCDASTLNDATFLPRPTGGTRVIEGNLEVRIALGSKTELATFTDFGQVWDARETLSVGDVELSPGVGFRYLSPIGPLRLDLAYRFRGGELLPVVTDQLRPFADGDQEDDVLFTGGDGTGWVRSGALALLGPRKLFDASPAGSLRRLQLHISIGQAF
jgi:hypothetical protein